MGEEKSPQTPDDETRDVLRRFGIVQQNVLNRLASKGMIGIDRIMWVSKWSKQEKDDFNQEVFRNDNPRERIMFYNCVQYLASETPQIQKITDIVMEKCLKPDGWSIGNLSTREQLLTWYALCARGKSEFKGKLYDELMQEMRTKQIQMTSRRTQSNISAWVRVDSLSNAQQTTLSSLGISGVVSAAVTAEGAIG